MALCCGDALLHMPLFQALSGIFAVWDFVFCSLRHGLGKHLRRVSQNLLFRELSFESAGTFCRASQELHLGLILLFSRLSGAFPHRYSLNSRESLPQEFTVYSHQSLPLFKGGKISC